MVENHSSKKSNDWVRITPGILISILVVAILALVVDWQEVLDALKWADYSYLLLGIPLYLMGYLFRAKAWRTILNDEVSLSTVFLIMQAGYLLNNILPLRLGELGRAYLLGRKKLGFWRVLSSIFVERAIDMILAAALLLGSIPFVFGSVQSQQAAYLIGGMVLAGLVVLHLLAKNSDRVISFYKKLSDRWKFLSVFGVNRLQTVFDGLSVLTDSTRFIRVLVWMFLCWGITTLYHYVVLLAFHKEAEIIWAAFGFGSAALGVALPSSPSYIGIIEAVWVGALAIFDVPYASALAYALTIHVLHILISLVFGIYALGREGESFGNLYEELRKRRLE
jgi:uncharacterized protein (TIRG00374 family)